jgi:hypothetical protein
VPAHVAEKNRLENKKFAERPVLLQNRNKRCDAERENGD